MSLKNPNQSVPGVVDEDRRGAERAPRPLPPRWSHRVVCWSRPSRTPRPSISPHTSRAPSRLMSQTATRAPSAARRRHVAAPIPLAPPVTIATCPSSLIARRASTANLCSRRCRSRPAHAHRHRSRCGSGSRARSRSSTSVSQRYGDFFTLRFVIGPIVFVADPQADQAGLHAATPTCFHAGEANATPLEPLMGRNSVLLLDGPEHMRQRKLMLPSFHGERMQRYGDLMQEIAEREIDALAGRTSRSACAPARRRSRSRSSCARSSASTTPSGSRG